VTRTAEFPDALAAGRRAGVPALIHVKTNVEQISPTATITSLRGARG
jgi:hypothetical protein